MVGWRARQTGHMAPGYRAAVEVVRELGFRVEKPVLIQETNNTVVWMRPEPIIAKVATRTDSADGLIREHQLVSALDRLGATNQSDLRSLTSCRFAIGQRNALPERLDRCEAPRRGVGGNQYEFMLQCGRDQEAIRGIPRDAEKPIRWDA